MKKSRDVLGLAVVGLTEGKLLGRVQDLIVSPLSRKVEALEVGERSFLKSKTDLIPFSHIRSIGSDAVTVTIPETTDQQDTPSEMVKRQLTGTQVVSVDGTMVGSVTDYSFNLQDGMLLELFISMDKPRSLLVIPVAIVESFGMDFIIIKEDYHTEAQQVFAGNHESVPQHFVHTLEMRAIDFATGRQVRNDIADDAGNIIVHKGATVTAETIESAKQKGKLPQLLLAAGVGELLDGVDFTREKLDAGSRKLMEAWHALRGRSYDWLQKKTDEERPTPTVELRDLWFKLQQKLTQGGRELENATRDKMRGYVMGKTLSQPVYDDEGTLLGARGDVVTEEMRHAADQARRLSQLFLSAATNDVQSALEPIKKQIQDILGERDRL